MKTKTKEELNQYPLWTAVITPLKSNGDLDLESLKNVLKQQEQAENGVLLLGSTGEALNLNDEEKKIVLNEALSLNLKVPLMVGIGGINLLETLDWLKFLERHPIDAYLMVTPLYAKPGPKGQYHWFKALLDQSTRPCMLYNIPGRAGKALEHEAVQKLKGHAQFWSIKEASGSTTEFARYVSDVKGHDIGVYSGDDGLLPQFFPLGCKGLVSVASNPWPYETNTWVKKVLSNKATLLDTHLWEQCSNALFIASNPIPAKVLMFDLKQIQSPILRPPLTHEEIETKEKLEILTSAHQKIMNWIKEQK